MHSIRRSRSSKLDSRTPRRTHVCLFVHTPHSVSMLISVAAWKLKCGGSSLLALLDMTLRRLAIRRCSAGWLGLRATLARELELVRDMVLDSTLDTRRPEPPALQ